MTPQELFDLLVERKKITLPVTGNQAESLRVQLVSKFTNYKRLLDDAGFLSDELKGSVLKTVRFESKTRYELAPKRIGFNYQILEDDDAPQV